MEKTCEHCDAGISKAHHSETFKKDLVSRLNRIEGQVRGITRMVQEDVYCDDVLNQINSVVAALNGVRKVLLEAHLKSCVAEKLSAGNLEVIDELMVTMSRMLK